jgi:hypothetical protein
VLVILHLVQGQHLRLCEEDDVIDGIVVVCFEVCFEEVCFELVHLLVEYFEDSTFPLQRQQWQ